jgi:2-C-methyl-D-erythritol 4-phosphate cytidylyltransferase
MKKYAIIVAGGTGSRMKVDVPKQFMLLGGKPVILYSIEAFHEYDPLLQIVIVVHPDYIDYWNGLCLEHKFTFQVQIVPGGETRFESVKNGLDVFEDEGLVAVHDAARPVIHADFIGNLYEEASVYGSAIPGIQINETIRAIEGEASRQLDRDFLRVMQTPQVFKVSALKLAYTQSYKPVFTDDAAVMESAGYSLHLTEGLKGNIKITHPQDIKLAEVLLEMNH